MEALPRPIPDEGDETRRMFAVAEVVEVLVHWYTERSQAEVERSLELDRKTVTR